MRLYCFSVQDFLPEQQIRSTSLSLREKRFAGNCGRSCVSYRNMTELHYRTSSSFVSRVTKNSKLDEPLFWQALEARGKRFGGKERRSKAFVVSPSFSTVVRQKFDALGLIPIEGTAQEFLEAIALPENLLTREQIISQLHPEVAHQLAATGEVSDAQRVH